MSKFWCVALAFGNAKGGGLVLGTRLAPSAEVAVAMTVSQYYVDAPAVRLPLAGVATLEITRELMEAALRQMDEDEAAPDPVVRLVPRAVPTIDELITNSYCPPNVEGEPT